MSAVAALGERGERGNECGTRRGADAYLRLAAEVGHREPSAIEVAQPDVDLDA